jgi:hypothetical protein
LAIKNKKPRHAVEIDQNVDMSWCREIISPTSKTLLICFSVATTYFEWTTFLREQVPHLDMSKIFISDVHGTWYHGNYKGLPGVGYKVLFKFLKKRIKKLNPDKIITLGASKAGYGAVLFGALLNADVVYSFSPQTIMDDIFYEKFDMHERVRKMQEELPTFKLAEETKDLRKVILAHKNNKTIYNIFYGSKNIEDVRNVKHISDLNNVIEHTLPYAHHKVSRDFLTPEYLMGMLDKEVLV